MGASSQLRQKQKLGPSRRADLRVPISLAGKPIAELLAASSVRTLHVREDEGDHVGLLPCRFGVGS